MRLQEFLDMSKLIISFFLLISFFCSSQKSEYLYSIKFLKCCNEPTHHDPKWSLRCSNKVIYQPENHQIIVPDTGQYFLISSIYDNQPIPIKIKRNLQVDTVFLKCLNIERSENLANKRHWESAPIYTTCAGRINSTYKEYFPDGVLRLVGNFSNGLLIDSLIEYYHSGVVKSKVKKDKTTYKHWVYYPNGAIKNRSQYDLKKRKRYQFYEYNEFGKLLTETDYSKKYSYIYYETGTFKTTNPGRRFESYFIVNDSIRYQYKKGIETTYYSSGKKKFEFSSKPLFWMDRFKGSKENIEYVYRLQVFHDDSANVKIQEVRFLSRNEISIYRSGLFKLEIADASSITFYKNGDIWITIYPIVYEGEKHKEVVLYGLYDYSINPIKYVKLKPEELDQFLMDRNLVLKCW